MGRQRGDDINFVAEAIRNETIGSTTDFALNYIRSYGKERPISMMELINELRKNKDILWDIRALTYLAFNEGIKGEIKIAIHLARKKDKEPFLQVKGVKGKIERGYMYGDYRCKDIGATWMGRFLDWKSRRDKWEEEKKLDLEILEKVLEKVENYNQRQELIKVKELYVLTKRNKNKEEKTDEDENN